MEHKKFVIMRRCINMPVTGEVVEHVEEVG